MRGVWVVCVLGALVFGCDGEGDPSFDYPMDDTLRLDHVQALGTHNSYHIAPDPVDLPEWDYTHPPLGEQLSRGVRQFELDLNVNVFDERFEVYHIIRIDDGTTCFLFTECLQDMKDWSDDNRAHHPIAVMIELKDGFDAGYAETFFDLFESEISSVWPEDRIVTPDLVRREHDTVGAGIAAHGWPTLGELRGRILFFILDTNEHRTFYTSNDRTLEGRLAFVNSSPGSPYAAVAVYDNPIRDASEIAAANAANMLVRTRIDGDGPNIDPARLSAAMSAGPHFLSSDDPAASLSDGAPSRCNPVTAPAGCTSAAIEDPAFIQ